MDDWRSDNRCVICVGRIVPLQISTISLRRLAREGGYPEEPPKNDIYDRYYDNAWSQEHTGYDPEAVLPGDKEPDSDGDIHILWNTRIHCLNYNNATKKSFLAGAAGCKVWSWAFSTTLRSESDASFEPEADRKCKCGPQTEEDRPIIFHWCCFELFLQAVTGTNNVKKLDLALAHDVFSNHHNTLESKFKAQPGGEWIATNPGPSEVLLTHVKRSLSENDFCNIKVRDAARLSDRVRHDPFSVLPPELIHYVAENLPIEDFFRLTLASWVVNATVRKDQGFWKIQIGRAMPWYWELIQALNDPVLTRDKDLKGVLLWATRESRGFWGMKGAQMIAANRRRIWERFAAPWAAVYKTGSTNFVHEIMSL